MTTGAIVNGESRTAGIWASSFLLAAIAVLGWAILRAGPKRPGDSLPLIGSAAQNDAQDVHARSIRVRGMAVQFNTFYQADESFRRALDEIAELGANSVLLSTAGYMEHAHAQAIYIDSRKLPSREEFVELIRHARKRGLYVILMPIVLLSNPRGSEWRGVIDPPDWTEWWRQYDEFILYFADLAQEGGADAFTVGSELVSTEKYTPKWERIVEQVRKRFTGKLGYSANWDHYKPVKFWDRLDFLGMTSYYTLADQDDPSIEQIVKKWKPIRDQIMDWARTTGKPLYLTEVGWCSQEGAAQAPWNYYQNQRATAAGMEEQRRLYEAFIRAWEGTSGLEGVMWWEWTHDGGGTSDYGYTPKGKPAERVLRDWFAESPPRR